MLIKKNTSYLACIVELLLIVPVLSRSRLGPSQVATYVPLYTLLKDLDVGSTWKFRRGDKLTQIL